jgi:hypothetical protein
MPQVKREIDLRHHQRILVPASRKIRAESQGGSRRLEGIVSVIGLGGIFVRTRSSEPTGAVLRLKLTDPLVSFESDCTVRSVAQNGMGFEFTAMAPSDEQKLKFLLRQMKS